MTDGYKIKRELIWVNENYNDMQGPCPDGFHVPLKSDFDDLVSCMTTFGLNTSGYYQSMLKMPNNGFRQYNDGAIYNTNQGRYWSSSASTGTEYAYHLVFSSSNPSSTVSTNSGLTKEYGCNIRPFKDTPVAPDSSWTELYSNSIYHNSTLGLISIKNGSSWITISDKNLGATVVFNSGDTVTADNGGTWYQRGNNYGFPRSGSVTTSSTQVNTTGYGPGNYYSRNVFVVSSSLRDWSSVTNNNLRGGVSQGSGTRLVEKQIYPASRLPSDYQEVEYIQSSGTQYLNTGILGENKYIMDAKFMFTALSGSNSDDTLIGASGSSRPSYLRYIQKRGVGGGNYWSQMIGSSYEYSRGTPYVDTEYTVKAQLATTGNYLTVNGTTYTWSYTSAYNCGYNMYIFGSNNAGTFGNQSSIKLFYLKISDLSETPVREFIPCYRKSDSVIGMYDLVNDVFYTNSGSGTFTKGPNV